MPNTISESPSNSSIADTLRAMAKWNPMITDPRDIAALEAGAAAWEIVRQIAAEDPTRYSLCPYCGERTYKQSHRDDCLWLQARTLVNGH